MVVVRRRVVEDLVMDWRSMVMVKGYSFAFWGEVKDGWIIR